MINISKTDIRLGMNTTPAKVSIQQTKAEFEMTTKHPRVKIDTEPIQIQIDQRQCFNESGLKDFATLRRDNASDGRQAVLEGVARRVSEGNMIADPRSGKNAIADIAFNNSFRTHVFNMETMPKSRPQIDFIGGTVDITVEEGYVDIKSAPKSPIIDVQVGGVEISVERYPEIKIEYVEDKVDVKL